MKYPKTIETLINSYKKLPGIGEKTAERMALTTLKMNEEVVKEFAKALLETKTKIKICKICNNICEGEICIICADEKRERKVICVVEDVKKIILVEKLNVYKGLYHILTEPVSPLLGSEKIDLLINPLIERIKKEGIEELMFALKLSIEGETTIAYIHKLLEDEPVKITRIAQGIPLGVDIDYIDALTLERAIEERKTM